MTSQKPRRVLTPGHAERRSRALICYPDRLLELVNKWKDTARNMVCTIKFQGDTDFKTLNEFSKIPGSQVRHLFNNKHELTWSRLERQRV